MRLVVPFRRWLDSASVPERATTGAVAAVVLALLAWGLAPAPTERSTDADALSASGDASDSLTGEALPQDAAAAVGETGPNGPGGAAAASPGRGRTSAGSTGSAGGRSPAGGAAPGGATGLTASDRGITPDVIKVGFTTLNFDTAAELGYANDLRRDSSKAVDAFVDYVNKRGGVLGRRIQPVKVLVDLVNAEQQRQKCLELTETHGVFAVIDSFAFSGETSTACVTAERKTLLVNGNPGSSENVRRGFPYHASVHKDDNRKMKDLVFAAKGAGFFDPAKGFKKLGLLIDACSDSVNDAPDGLMAYLRAAGVTSWSEFRADCGNTAQGPPQQAVLRFKQDDVTHVLMAARPPIVKEYLDAAKGARYFPEYFLGDYFNLIQGIFNDDYDPEGLDGALAVTETHAGEGSAGKPLPPLAQHCSKILTDNRLAPVSSAPPHELGDDMEVLGLCEHLLLFVQVATAAGPNLTRTTWVNALAGVGDFRPATTDLARFDRRGKMTGGDTMKLVQWHRDCKCWRELTGFGPAAG